MQFKKLIYAATCMTSIAFSADVVQDRLANKEYYQKIKTACEEYAHYKGKLEQNDIFDLITKGRLSGHKAYKAKFSQHTIGGQKLELWLQSAAILVTHSLDVSTLFEKITAKTITEISKSDAVNEDRLTNHFARQFILMESMKQLGDFTLEKPVNFENLYKSAQKKSYIWSYRNEKISSRIKEMTFKDFLTIFSEGAEISLYQAMQMAVHYAYKGADCTRTTNRQILESLDDPDCKIIRPNGKAVVRFIKGGTAEINEVANTAVDVLLGDNRHLSDGDEFKNIREKAEKNNKENKGFIQRMSIDREKLYLSELEKYYHQQSQNTGKKSLPAKVQKSFKTKEDEIKGHLNHLEKDLPNHLQEVFANTRKEKFIKDFRKKEGEVYEGNLNEVVQLLYSHEDVKADIANALKNANRDLKKLRDKALFRVDKVNVAKVADTIGKSFIDTKKTEENNSFKAVYVNLSFGVKKELISKNAVTNEDIQALNKQLEDCDKEILILRKKLDTNKHERDRLESAAQELHNTAAQNGLDLDNPEVIHAVKDLSLKQSDLEQANRDIEENISKQRKTKDIAQNRYNSHMAKLTGREYDEVTKEFKDKEGKNIFDIKEHYRVS